MVAPYAKEMATQAKAMVLIFPELQATLATLCSNRRELSSDSVRELESKADLSEADRAAEIAKVNKGLEKFLEKYTPEVLLRPFETMGRGDAEPGGVLNAVVRRMSVTAAPSLFTPSEHYSSGDASAAGALRPGVSGSSSDASAAGVPRWAFGALQWS